MGSSKEYRHKYYLEIEKPKRHAKPKLIKKCLLCGKDFIAYSSCQNYCKHIECRNKYKKQRQEWTIGWRKRKQSHIQSYNLSYRDKDRNRSRQYAKQYKQTLNGRLSARLNQRKRQRLEQGLTLKTIQMVYEDNIKKYGTLTCILCNKIIEFGQDSLEHLTPLCRGGSNEYNNLGVSHNKCNCKKHIKTLEEWKEYNGKIIDI